MLLNQHYNYCYSSDVSFDKENFSLIIILVNRYAFLIENKK